MGVKKKTEVQQEQKGFQDNGEFLLYMQRVATVGAVIGGFLCCLVLYAVFVWFP